MIINKEDFLKTLTDEQLNAGYLKFNIPDEDNPTDLSGEGVWGWTTPDEKKKYDDDTYNGKIVAILTNQPIEYYGRLNWGDEVVLQCHGDSRPTDTRSWMGKRKLDMINCVFYMEEIWQEKTR